MGCTVNRAAGQQSISLKMNYFLVFFLVIWCFSNNVKSDESSSEESDESSEEKYVKSFEHLECVDYLKVEEVESCFTKKCKSECVASNLKTAGVTKKFVPESCKLGCKNQISSFKKAQAVFPKTSAELLLGTAVDKCWDGCIDGSSESDQVSCISGCETMRNIQRKQLRSNVKNPQRVADPNDVLEIPNAKFYGTDEKKTNLAANEGLKTLDQNEEEPAHAKTYILWHPMDQQHAYQAYNVMMNIVQQMFQGMDDMDKADNDNQMKAGWKDDRRQLRIPQYKPRVAALTSAEGEASQVYNKVVDSLDTLKGKIQETISQPAFKENVFYCLMTICCFLLLTALYDNCTEKSTAETEEDHFIVPDKANTVKLPTYEDCIKADKFLAVDLKDTKESEDLKEAGDVTKADLSLSFSVVLDDEELLQK